MSTNAEAHVVREALMLERNPKAHPDLIDLKSRLEKQRDDLASQIERVDKEIQSVLTTLRLLGHHGNKADDIVQQTLVVPDLQGLTQHDALIKLARANNNRVRISQAKDILLHEKLISSPKHAYTILYNVLTKSDRFKKVRPGEFELIERPVLKQLTINVGS